MAFRFIKAGIKTVGDLVENHDDHPKWKNAAVAAAVAAAARRGIVAVKRDENLHSPMSFYFHCAGAFRRASMGKCSHRHSRTTETSRAES